MKRFLAAILAVAFILSFAGCAPGGSSAAPEPSSATEPSSVSEPASASEASGTPEEAGERITDYNTLFTLWHDYLYYAYMDFSTPETAIEDPDGVARFAYRALLEYGDSSLIRSFTATAEDRAATEALLGFDVSALSAGNTVYAVSAGTLAHEAQRWFDFAIDDPAAYFSAVASTHYTGPYYLPTTDEVVFTTASLDEMRYANQYVEYPEKSWFGMAIQQAFRYGDGRIEVTLSMDDTWAQGKIGSLHTVTLLPRGDGDGYRIKSYAVQYEDLERYQLSGSYTLFDEAASALPKASPYEYELCAEGPDSFYLCLTESGEESCTVTVVGINKQTLARTALLEYTAARNSKGARRDGVSLYQTTDGLRICDAKRVVDYDWSLKETRRQPVPEEIRAVITGEDGGYFAGYAVLSDFSLWFFSDKAGLWRYDPASGEKALLSASEIGTGKLMEGAVIIPQLQRPVAGDSTLYYFTYGYESLGGHTAVDVATGTLTALEPPRAQGDYLDRGGVTLDTVAGRGMILLVNKSEVWVPHYYDFAAKSWTALSDLTQTLFGHILLNGGTLAVVSGGKVDTFTATVYDLATGESRPANYSLTCPYGFYSDSYPGVLSDGRLLFCYKESPDETHFALLG